MLQQQTRPLVGAVRDTFFADRPINEMTAEWKNLSATDKVDLIEMFEAEGIHISDSEKYRVEAVA